MLCSKCHKNVAVIFITKLEGDKQTNEGLCLSCAKSMGIAPIEQFVGQMGIDDSDIDAISDELNSMMQGIENGDIPEELEQEMENASESAPQTMNLLGKMFDRFGGEQKEKEAESGGTDGRPGAEPKQTKTATRFKKKKKKMLETYGLNLSAKAAQGLVDKVIGRDAEIDLSLIHISE
ncbi:MAG TPA: ATP-dependent Clp protease ATP-binding subunit, partial [Candidatus Aphodoplasma excrementigallinarum]|nr:ATP-dependent Clp protease ATP-binding subunit [Candidatus Aphodoplasma excrementigallinarum]